MRSIAILAGLLCAAVAFVTRVADRATQPATQPARAAMVASVTPDPAATGSRRVIVPRDARGHFQVDARVDGRAVGFMIDTGASTIALTARDARRLGIHPVQNDYTASVRTANGVARAAPVTLEKVEVGDLVVRDVPALVISENALSENLLGLSFLTRLRRFEYTNGKLVLEQ
jgi:aspartyl protease family protein